MGMRTRTTEDNETTGAGVALKRTRQYHTRSRTGCSTCRQRHIRCDEARPLCSNCVIAAKHCVYAPTQLPLRDRRAQAALLPPWKQTTWAVEEAPSSLSSFPSSSSSSWSTSSSKSSSSSSPWQLLQLGSAMDPFDTLPIKMPFKSKELFHYFYQAGETFGVMPTDKTHDCVALTSSDPFALRSTLLIAGLHHSWNAGSLRYYESTFLSHKVESMRLVNTLLVDSRSRTATTLCSRLVATLCFAECCVGNLATAETHLAGLLALTDIRDPQIRVADTPEDDVDAELVDRYLLLTYNFIHGLKARVSDFTLDDDDDDDHSTDNAARKSDPAEVDVMMRKWHVQENGGLHNRLKAMRLFPHFFSSPLPGRKPRDIDAGPVVRCLEDITLMVDLRRSGETAGDIGGKSWSRVWNDGGPSRLLVEFVNSHVASLSPPTTKPRSTRGFTCAWSAIATATGLYLNSVLGLWNDGQPIDRRLHRRVLLILKRDIDRTGHKWRDYDGVGKDLWFWVVFTGAFSLARDDAHGGASRAMRAWLCDRVRGWSEVVGVKEWVDARAALKRIVWPAVARDERLAEVLWETTVRGKS